MIDIRKKVLNNYTWQLNSQIASRYSSRLPSPRNERLLGNPFGVLNRMSGDRQSLSVPVELDCATGNPVLFMHMVRVNVLRVRWCWSVMVIDMKLIHMLGTQRIRRSDLWIEIFRWGMSTVKTDATRWALWGWRLPAVGVRRLLDDKVLELELFHDWRMMVRLAGSLRLYSVHTLEPSQNARNGSLVSNESTRGVRNTATRIAWTK